MHKGVGKVGDKGDMFPSKILTLKIFIAEQ